MSEQTLTILAVDDDPVDTELLGRALQRISGLKTDLVHVRDQEEALQALDRVAVDLLFVDYRLGGQTGLELIQHIRTHGELRPVICLTEYSDPNLVKALLQAGADDYLLKSELAPDSLRRAIEYSLACYHRRQTERCNEQLLLELKIKSEQLEKNNRRLAELYETAHQFVDNVSHEFRTPLTVIKEFAAILRDGLAGPQNEKQTEYLSLIIHRSDDLSLMVDDMLDMSRLEAGLLGVHRTTCRVGDIIEGVRVMLERRAAASKIILEFTPGVDDLPDVFCDPDRIRRVLINLAVNAIKFSPEGGRIRIGSRNDPRKNEVVMFISDQGPGIAKDQLAVIFERFRQIDSPTACTCRGFGLGLSIAEELVKLNLGEIGVESERGLGSTFHFSIPHSDPLDLIKRYFRISGDCEGRELALVTASSDAIGPDAEAEVEEFIHHHVPAKDIVFRTAPGNWLIVTPRSTKDANGCVAALDRAWAESNRNRPVRPLPRVELELIGSWPMPLGKPVFLKAFENEIHAKEVALVGQEAAHCG